MAATNRSVTLYGAIGVLVVALAAAGWYITQLHAENARLAASPPPADQVTSTRPPAAPMPAANPRTITPQQRTAMLEKLGNGHDPVWFATVPTNPETVAYQKMLQSVFEEAGWQIKSVVPVRFSLKPGIYVFSAEEEPPEYVQRALDAFDAAGITLTVGRGYRDFYRQMKSDNPNWVGFEMSPEQTYVVVIGRQPDNTPIPQ